MSLSHLILIRAGTLITLISRKGKTLSHSKPSYLGGDLCTQADITEDLSQWSFRIVDSLYHCSIDDARKIEVA